MTFMTDPDHLEARLCPSGAGVQRDRPLQKKVEDTSTGCRDRAAASLVAAAAMDTLNGKARLEASAATWTARADLLLRLERGMELRESLLPDEFEPAAPRS